MAEQRGASLAATTDVLTAVRTGAQRVVHSALYLAVHLDVWKAVSLALRSAVHLVCPLADRTVCSMAGHWGLSWAVGLVYYLVVLKALLMAACSVYPLVDSRDSTRADCLASLLGVRWADYLVSCSAAWTDETSDILWVVVLASLSGHTLVKPLGTALGLH